MEKSFQLNLSHVLSHLSQSKPVKLIANILTIFNTVLSLCRDQPINLHYKLMRWFLYSGLLPQGFKNLCKSLEEWGGSKTHNMTWLIALKSFLNVSDNPQINVLASALFYSIAIIRGSLEYPFHYFILPHEIHFQKEFFEGNLPFIPPNIIISWIRSVSTNTCNW